MINPTICFRVVTHLLNNTKNPHGGIFYALKEAQILIDTWRKDYNIVRPHSALGYRPPAPEAIMVPNAQFQLIALT